MKKVTKLALTLSISGLAFSTAAWSAAKCEKHDKAEWMTEEAVKSKLVTEGYTIKFFKVDGDCYEMYGTIGTGKDKKKAELYLDTKTAAVVKSKIK